MPFEIGEEIHRPDPVGIDLRRLEHGRPVLEELRLGARDRRQRPVLLGLHEMVGGRFRHIDRVHLAARHRKAGVGAALVALHDVAIELERLAGEGRADAQARRSARGGPAPFLLGIDRLLHLADRRVRPHQPEAGRRAHGREVGELGQVVARGLIARQLREPAMVPWTSEICRPSGGAMYSLLSATRPPAPGTFSTMTVVPSVLAR